MDEHKHSGIGIASFITSIVSGCFLFLTFVIAGVMESSTPGGMDSKSSASAMVGLFLITFLGAALVALGLGISGLLQKDRKKIFSILGTVFSAVLVFATILLVLVGLAMG